MKRMLHNELKTIIRSEDFKSMNKKRVIFSSVLIGIFVTLFTIYEYTSYSDLKTTNISETNNMMNLDNIPTIQSSAQYMRLSFEDRAKIFPIVVLATVESIETELADESEWSSHLILDDDMNVIGESEATYEERIVPYTFVTLRVDEYIKDETDVFSDTIRVRGEANGEGSVKGEPVLFQNNQITKYLIGEQSMYFIDYRENENLFRINSYSGKFVIDENNMVQSELHKGFIENSKFTDSEISQIMSENLTTLNGEQIRQVVLDSLPIPLDEAITRAQQAAQQ